MEREGVQINTMQAKKKVYSGFSLSTADVVIHADVVDTKPAVEVPKEVIKQAAEQREAQMFCTDAPEEEEPAQMQTTIYVVPESKKEESKEP